MFIPADLEEQKILATGVYGTNLVGVQRQLRRRQPPLHGAVRRASDWAFVNINLRPYYAEGSKTLAFEIAEQLGWELPDRCIVPVASGSLFTKIARGLPGVDRARSARAARLPRMNGAQAEGCSPVASAFADGHDVAGR